MLLATKLDPSSLHSNQVHFNSTGNALGHSGASAVVHFPLLGRDQEGKPHTHTKHCCSARGCRLSTKEMSLLLLITALSSALVSDLQSQTSIPRALARIGKKLSCTGQVRISNVCVCIPLGIPVTAWQTGWPTNE